jgi:hypothetical protein
MRHIMEYGKLVELWDILGDIPVNDNQEIEEEFHKFSVGTSVEEIWHWFESQNKNFSVAEMMGFTK